MTAPGTDPVDHGPLGGVCIAWIGAENSASSLLHGLETAGASVLRLPLVEFVQPQNPSDLKDALNRLDSFDWLVFTSVQAVRAVGKGLKMETRVAAVGPGSARQLEQLGYKVDLVPTQHDAAGLAEAMIGSIDPPGSVLFVRGDKAGRTLPDRLTRAGFAVTRVVGYGTEPVSPHRAKIVLEKIKRSADLVIAGSSLGVSTLKNASSPTRLGDLKPRLRWLCLGRATRDGLVREGVENAVFPSEITPDGVVECAIREVRTLRGG